MRWLIGRFGAFRPKGRRVESLSSHHIGTLGKSFTRRCLWRFGVKFRHSTFKLPIYLETVNYTLNNVYYDNLACLIVMVMFDSAAVCSLTTESLQYSLIVTSCGLTAVYCIKRRYTHTLSVLCWVPLWVVVDLKRCYRNSLNEWMRE